MTVRLEAISEIDGTGIVRSGEVLRLLRPPYTLQDSPALPEESLHDAISRFGFSPSEEQFPSWEQAIEFLNLRTVESRRALGIELPESIDGASVIEAASEDVLNDFLLRVDRDLIPGRLFDHAENFLVAFLASSALTSYPALARRAAELLQRSRAARQRTEAAGSELASRDARFPALEKHGELKKCAQTGESIEKRHCVFAVA
jgi:hypothetical protein